MLTSVRTRVIVELGLEKALRLPCLPGACLTCLEGIVWITRDGNPNDLVLEAGMTYPLSLKGTVVQALRPARICFTTARVADAMPQRIIASASPDPA